jgi:hypothetical protein
MAILKDEFVFVEAFVAIAAICSYFFFLCNPRLYLGQSIEVFQKFTIYPVLFLSIVLHKSI